MEGASSAPARPPGGYEELRDLVGARYDALSARLRQIAEYALANPNDVALETVAVVAERAGVQPSALIRFAQALGYDGFSEMQRVFRTRLVGRASSYRDRLRAQALDDGYGPRDVLHHFVVAGHQALDHLKDDLDGTVLERAVGLLADARVVHLVAQRRAFPVVAYMAYGLSHLGKRMQLLDGIGGMLAQQARTIGSDDALIAVSFRPYAAETLAVAAEARDSGVPLIAITDGPLSPIARLGDAALFVEDAEVHTFRALTASMCLATTLVIALGHRMVARGDGNGALR